jgi:general stress protein 26
MSAVSDADKDQFFADVDAACRKAVWAAVATEHQGGPRVRLVHPTWDGEVLWFATGKSTPKAAQVRANSAIDIQYQVAPPEFVHILVRGTAEVLEDQATKDHVWEVMDYDLADFWPDGPTAEEYVCVKITPSRVELSEMFGMNNKRVWKG